VTPDKVDQGAYPPRRAMRLEGYDYAEIGGYFITICTQDRLHLFGRVTEEGVELTDAGGMVERWWHEIPNGFPSACLDEFVIMPDHFHGIVLLLPPNPVDDGPDRAPCTPLSELVRWFKTMTTNEYIREVKCSGWPRFPGRLWQRNYYDHVIRDNDELNGCREYIRQNPAKWLAGEGDTEAPEWPERNGHPKT